MGSIERDLSLFTLPAEEKQWTLAANRSGRRFRRVEEAAEQCTKRWFVKEKYKVKNDECLRYKKCAAIQVVIGPKAWGGGGGGEPR